VHDTLPGWVELLGLATFVVVVILFLWVALTF